MLLADLSRKREGMRITAISLPLLEPDHQVDNLTRCSWAWVESVWKLAEAGAL